MSFLKRLNRGFLIFNEYFFVIDSVAICLLILVNALLRYIFKAELYGSNDIVLLCAAWLYYLGSAVATYSDEHIAADMIHNSLKTERARCIHDIIRMFLCLAMYILVTVWVYQYFGFVVAKHQTTSMLKIPTWTSVLSLVISFTLSVIYTIANIVKKFEALRALPEGKEGGDAQ